MGAIIVEKNKKYIRLLDEIIIFKNDNDNI